MEIEVIDESTYSYGSTDNNFSYSKTYFGKDAQDYPTSKYGIKLYSDNQIIDSCLIVGSGGATRLHKNSSVFDNDQLVICCSSTIFCIGFPELNLNWPTTADQATCFQIFNHEENYIIHGELQITMLTKEGDIKWEFSGADIFVSFDNEEVFEIESDGIQLTDFSKTKYKIDFEGKLLWDTYKQ
ncbi:hypothetical protein [Spirosoma daeguense]